MTKLVSYKINNRTNITAKFLCFVLLLFAFFVDTTKLEAANSCDIKIYRKESPYNTVGSVFINYDRIGPAKERYTYADPIVIREVYDAKKDETIQTLSCPEGFEGSLIANKLVCAKDNGEQLDANGHKFIEIKGSEYFADTGEKVYGIQPALSSGNTMCYCEATPFNYSSCEGKQNKNTDYRCGIAFLIDRYKSADYGTLLTALRMWVSYKSNLRGQGQFGNEEDGNQAYKVNTDFYNLTATQVAKGNGIYNGINCDINNPKLGIMCSGASKYTTALTYFLNAYNGFGVKVSSSGTPELSTKIINETTTSILYKNVLTENIKQGDAHVIIRFGDEVVNKADAICKDGKCVASINTAQIMEKCKNITDRRNKTWNVQLVIKNYNSKGLVREYQHCTDPTKYQIMYVVSENNDNDKVTTYSSSKVDISVACAPKVCNQSNRCTNDKMKVTNTLSEKCKYSDETNADSKYYDGYSTGVVKDPEMNCILNACDEGEKENYDQSKVFGVDSSVCKIYCREESEFYIANKIKVYAGMQFQFKLESKLGSTGKTVTNSNNQHLTSLVYQTMQCTSEIYYDRAPENGRSWLDRYDETVKNMVKSWNEYIKWKALSDGGHQIITKTAPKYSDNNPDHSCSCSCQLVGYYKQNIWYWPSEFGSVRYNVTNISSLTQSGKLAGLFNDPESKESYHESSGIPPTGDVCYRVVTEHNPAARCTCSDCLRANCNTRQYGNNGVPGSDIVTSRLKESYNEYILQKNEATRLIKELKNCNLLPDSDAKEAVNNLSNCSIKGNCIELDVKYDDKKYGTKTRLAKTVKPGTVVTYCKNSSNETDSNFNPECYNYDASNPSVTNEPTSIIMNEADHHEMICNEDESVPVDKVTCDGKKIKLPTNDNVTFTSTRETDFYQNNDYATRVYSGVVERAKSDGTSLISLDKNVYPVSLDEKSGGKTGLYNINYIFTNIWMTPHSNAEEYCHTCSYEVFNNTTLYDCTDDESCNACSMKENKSIIESKNIDGWNQVASKKGYGYVFRPIDLADIFPDEERNRGSNWTSEGALNLIDSIESSANDIYGNDSKLQYSYTLSPKSIDNIRKHNLSQSDSSAGGYTNSSLGECMVIDNSFYNCKSSFLDKESLEEMGVIVNKTQ